MSRRPIAQLARSRILPLLILLAVVLLWIQHKKPVSKGITPTELAEARYHIRERLNVSHVYVLAGNAVRKKNMKLMLDFADIPFEFVDGPDPYGAWINKMVEDPEIAPAFDKEFNIHDIPNYYRHTLACGLGHRKIYRDAQERGFERILIFEDDIDIDAHIMELMQSIWEEVPKDWDILMLGHAVPQPRSQWKHPDSEGRVDGLNWASQTHAYIVRKRILKTLLEATDDIPYTPIDRIIMRYLPGIGALKLYGVRPPLVVQINTVVSLLSHEISDWGRGHFGGDGLAYLSGAWTFK